MNLSRKGVVGAYIFMTFLVLNIANLLLNPYMEAIPDPEYDTLFRTGIIPMIKPQLTNSGIASMAWILLFVIAVIFSKRQNEREYRPWWLAILVFLER